MLRLKAKNMEWRKYRFRKMIWLGICILGRLKMRHRSINLHKNPSFILIIIIATTVYVYCQASTGT
ncbi:hypothetical protein NQ315_001139 [Exocentrus adspersus]|uniref:Uncharacterized protein n=1 Tax=Exocentrus adspersus TaxID=1586481 RepID=A0AAV8WEM7_9CUCU|nr:hypothetical protein NQ315_001139 [Exocentrus adspersus]